jgi:hypothetical protein
VAEDAEEQTVSDEEMADQLRSIKVVDMVVQASARLVSLGFVRLAGDQRDLDQARLAIDCLRALEPVLREQVSAELANELSGAVASLQLAYAEAVKATESGTASAGEEPVTEPPVEGGGESAG